MGATHADYAWLSTDESRVTEAYCITWIDDATIEDVIEGLSAVKVGSAVGWASLEQTALDRTTEVFPSRLGGTFMTFVPGAALIGLARYGTGTLMLEPNGYVGVTHELIGPLSRGREAVAHYRNVNAYDRFQRWTDGSIQSEFEPMFAFNGDLPEGMRAEMLSAGFDDSPARSGDYLRHTAAAFALAERLTGVRITPDLLRDIELVTAQVTLPGP